MVEDDPGLRQQLRRALAPWDVLLAGDRESALSALHRSAPDVVALDLGLPPQPQTPEEGFRALSQIMAQAPYTRVVAVTGQDSHQNAVRAIGCGAFDFIPKPIEAGRLRETLERAIRIGRLEREHQGFAQDVPPGELPGIVTNDPGMREVCRRIERLAPIPASVALFGESGTGKEGLARALHQRSPRAQAAFVAINCAALPEGLIESELFGFERGAFTGAVRTTPGRIERAHQGTLFLDEIGDLPLHLQAKLLRFLQERTLERLGGRDTIAVDVRVICATHRPLDEMIRSGQFREDLYYRLCEIRVDVPPLRERIGDASLLAQTFLARFSTHYERPGLRLSEAAIEAIARHRWPGNVRELENAMRRGVILAERRTLSPEDLGLESIDTERPCLDLRRARETAERRTLALALARSPGNLSRTAELLGVSRPTLYDLLRRFGMR